MAFLPRASKVEQQLITYKFWNPAKNKFDFRKKYKEVEVKEEFVHRITVKLYEEDYNEFETLMCDEYEKLGYLLIDLALMYINDNSESDVKKLISSMPKISFKDHITKQAGASLTRRQCKPIYQLHNDTGIGESTIVRILAKEQLKKITSTKQG